MTPTERHLSPVDLDVLLVARPAPALPAGTAAGDHLSHCPDCQARAAAHLAQAQAFERHRMPRLLTRAARPARSAGSWLAGAAAAVGVAALALVTWTVRDTPPGIKGPASSLRAVIRRGGQVFEAPDGAVLAPGDAVRFVVAAAPGAHLLVASVDGAGKVSVYHPYGGDGSTPVETGTAVEVPAGSIVLDSAPGPERVFALFSSVPIAAEPLRRQLETLGRQGGDAIRRQTQLDLPDTLQLTFYFEKSEDTR